MKVALVSDWFFPKTGGIATHIDGLAKALMKIGVDVEVISTRLKIPSDQTINFPYPVIKLNLPIFPGIDLPVFNSEKILKEVLDLREIDLVHAHHAFTPLSLNSIRASYNIGLPSVLTAHSLAPDLNLTFLRLAAKFFRIREEYEKLNKMIAVSNAVKRFMSNFLDGRKIEVIYNGVDTEKYRPPSEDEFYELRDFLGLNEENIILFLGRISYRKGIHLLLPAMFNLDRSLRERTRLLIIGEGELSPWLEEKIRDVSNKVRVSYLGYVPNSKVIMYMKASDIVLVPSIYGEAFGVVIIEAMACGKPVIGTKVGGIPEIIEHMKSGLLVPSNDPKSIAKALTYLLENKEICVEMGRFGRYLCVKKYDWSVIARDVLRVYEEFVQSP
ncbi:MAG: glycosyltransferase family 4 protein [Candidatus Asgardarchaeia archaeon]